MDRWALAYRVVYQHALVCCAWFVVCLFVCLFCFVQREASAELINQIQTALRKLTGVFVVSCCFLVMWLCCGVAVAILCCYGSNNSRLWHFAPRVGHSPFIRAIQCVHTQARARIHRRDVMLLLLLLVVFVGCCCCCFFCCVRVCVCVCLCVLCCIAPQLSAFSKLDLARAFAEV